MRCASRTILTRSGAASSLMAAIRMPRFGEVQRLRGLSHKRDWRPSFAIGCLFKTARNTQSIGRLKACRWHQQEPAATSVMYIILKVDGPIQWVRLCMGTSRSKTLDLVPTSQATLGLSYLIVIESFNPAFCDVVEYYLCQMCQVRALM